MKVCVKEAMAQHVHSQVSGVQLRQLAHKRAHERIFGDHDRVCR